MKQLTLQEHKSRIEHINSAERDNKKYTKRHRIVDYMPGQATYNLGDYPAKFSIAPTEYDYQLLKSMAENGVELIQIHEEWNDAIRHLGADKFTSFDPVGLQQFVDMCHSFGIKIIPYISTGYFQITDPDFRNDFIRGPYDFKANYFHFAKCYAGSAAWREYILPKTFAVLDKYGFDGIYNDWGYDGLNIEYAKHENKGKDMIAIPYDPELEDLLCMIYSEVKRRGGVYKVHADKNYRPPTKDRVYDYLWIGEGVKDKNVGICKDYQPYLVPCQHMDFAGDCSQDDYYARVIPFLQFPLLKTGRPLTGASICEPDIDYCRDGKDGEYGFFARIREYMKKNPKGPYVYSLWSSIPDDPSEYAKWSKYLELYKPMVTQNSVVYIELRESAAICSQIPNDVYISMFVNEKLYLVASNLTEEEYTLVLRDEWTDRQNGTFGRSFPMKPWEILFLKR